MKRLGKNSSPKNAWKEAMNLLGRQRTAKPECTSNSDPSDTAEYQSQYFVKKITDLLNKLPTDKEENQFECKSCGKNFMKSSDCEAPFKCESCEEESREKHNLKNHGKDESSHSDNCGSEFKCDPCGKNFITEESLKNHFASVHDSTDKIAFQFQFVTAGDVTRVVN